MIRYNILLLIIQMSFKSHRKIALPLKVEAKKKASYSIKGILSVLPKQKNLEFIECLIEGSRNGRGKGEGRTLESIKLSSKSKDTGVQLYKETPKRASELQEGYFKGLRDRRLEAGRRFTFIAKNKKAFGNNLPQEGPRTPKAVVPSEAEISADLTPDRRKQYDLFLKKQISLIRSKNRCQSQSGIFRSFQSLIQYLA